MDLSVTVTSIAREALVDVTGFGVSCPSAPEAADIGGTYETSGFGRIAPTETSNITARVVLDVDGLQCEAGDAEIVLQAYDESGNNKYVTLGPIPQLREVTGSLAPNVVSLGNVCSALDLRRLAAVFGRAVTDPVVRNSSCFVYDSPVQDSEHQLMRLYVDPLHLNRSLKGQLCDGDLAAIPGLPTATACPSGPGFAGYLDRADSLIGVFSSVMQYPAGAKTLLSEVARIVDEIPQRR